MITKLRYQPKCFRICQISNIKKDQIEVTTHVTPFSASAILGLKIHITRLESTHLVILTEEKLVDVKAN